jgi:hypothetical protein
MTHAQKEVSIGCSEGRFLSGTHICYLFGDDEERLEMIARFLDAGRRGHERMIFLVDQESPAQVNAKLERHGFVPQGDLVTAQARDYYYPDGEFADERMLDTVRRFYEESIEAGYAGARGTGEMSWVLRGVKGTERALRYEARLTEVLAEYPSTCICQYDVRLFNGATVMDVLSTHPYTLVRGQLVRNPYYIEPARFLERYRANPS